MSVAFYVVVAWVALTLGLGWLYFERVRLPRPPVGVMSLGDVVVMLVAIVVVPLLYLALPVSVVAGLLALAIGSLLVTSLDPLLRQRWLTWGVVLALLALDVGATWRAGTASPAFALVNNAVLVLAVVGATNLWAQSGLKARDAAVLGGALAVYDVVATAWLPLMDNLITRLARLPFAPLVRWDLASGHGLAVGLGDLLLAAVFPLVMRKAYGRAAGRAALGVSLAALAGMLAALDLGLAPVTVPAMLVLGPLMVGQSLYWRRHLGPERTTAAYLAADGAPLVGSRSRATRLRSSDSA